MRAGGYRTLRSTFVETANAGSSRTYERDGGEASAGHDLLPTDRAVTRRRTGRGSRTSTLRTRPGVARRAPTGLQPGIVRPDGDSVVIDWDPARELVIADPTRRDLWLSSGPRRVPRHCGRRPGHPRVDWQVDARRHLRGRPTRRSSAVTVEAPFTAEDSGPVARPAVPASNPESHRRSPP